ncbi:MBL fold metallo-hydrolase [Arthrobacter sp. TWP1-1]|uniref:MBL fold metallo-hydrolase n=1 Tax=Arthrobacter sp. TWP1-1 TaxID=2804568 RepID=UPI003CF44054
MTDNSPGVRATFFGTSTVYLTDGTSHIMIDGFLTRPPLLRALLGRIAPNPRRIQELLARGGVSALDALFVAHSHYDHVMDSPEVIKQLGGTLYGSESSLNVGRGAKLGEDRMSVIADGEEFSFGDFTVRVIEGIHSPGNRYPGAIDTPLVTPTKASNYRDGTCYSFHITHPTGTVLIHPSANFVPNKFTGLDVDVLYLGVGILGTQTEEFRDDYWHHVVTATSPSCIIPVHWDDFGRPLSRNLRALPPVIDKFSVMTNYVERRCAEEDVLLIVQKAFETLDLFMPRAPSRA